MDQNKREKMEKKCTDPYLCFVDRPENNNETPALRVTSIEATVREAIEK